MIKNTYIGLRLSKDDKKLISVAADIERRPISQFMLKASIDKAAEVIGGQNE